MRSRIGARAIAAAVLVIAALAGASPAAAAWPDKPFRFVVPFPPGGSTDAVARAMQPALEKALGQPVIVENRAGAGGMLGVDMIAKAPADGYTFGIAGAGALGVNIGERLTRPYDPNKDLVLISRAAGSPFVLIANPTFDAKSLADVIARAKADPSKIAIGHGGNGTAMQLAAATFVSMAGLTIEQVPYRGTAPVVIDVLAGHVQLGIADPPPSMAAILDGKLKALAVTSSERFSVFPDVPTFEELGLKGFDLSGWFGIAAPGGTPPDVVKRLNEASVAALNDPEVIKRIRTIGMEPVASTPAEFGDFLAAEIIKAEKLQSVGGAGAR